MPWNSLSNNLNFLIYMKNNKDSQLIGLTIVLVAIAVIVGGWYAMSRKGGEKNISEDPYVKGFNTARDMAYQKGLRDMPSGNISGTVTEVSDSSIKIKTNLFVDERVDGVGQERVIRVSANAKVISRSERDDEIYRKEMDEFQQKMQSLRGEEETISISPPKRFTETEIKVSDLKIGDFVTVTVENQQENEEGRGDEEMDLRLVNPIEASYIYITAKNEREREMDMEEEVVETAGPEEGVVMPPEEQEGAENIE